MITFNMHHQFQHIIIQLHTHTHTPTIAKLYAALQPWTPCLPIRGGKLKTAKNYSTSNPQLSFSSCTSNAYMHNNRTGNTSCNSLNSSYIWREASPNNFNLYSTSVSSLNAQAAMAAAHSGNASLPTSVSNSPYRYSIGSNSRSPEWRSVSEEKSAPATNKKSFGSKFKPSSSSSAASNYENVCYVTPLLPQRKNRNPIKIVKKNSQENVHMQNVGRRLSNDADLSDDQMPYGLYDRRTNRSFEAPSRDTIRRTIGTTNGPLRRSTPHLLSDDIYADTEQNRKSKRHSATWCCGNFMLKQWKKVHQYD